MVTQETQWVGLTELRDVVEHIKRALTISDEKVALKELDLAFEHIRRSGVESIQKASTKIFLDVLEIIKKPSLIYKLAFIEVPDKQEVRELKHKIMEKIICGRSHKSNPELWMHSIKEFKDAIELSFELIDKFPTKAETRFRIFTVVCGIITILSLLITLYVLYFR